MTSFQSNRVLYEISCCLQTSHKVRNTINCAKITIAFDARNVLHFKKLLRNFTLAKSLNSASMRDLPPKVNTDLCGVGLFSSCLGVFVQPADFISCSLQFALLIELLAWSPSKSLSSKFASLLELCSSYPKEFELLNFCIFYRENRNCVSKIDSIAMTK